MWSLLLGVWRVEVAEGALELRRRGVTGRMVGVAAGLGGSISGSSGL